jgi:hypothetical protein
MVWDEFATYHQSTLVALIMRGMTLIHTPETIPWDLGAGLKPRAID